MIGQVLSNIEIPDLSPLTTRPLPHATPTAMDLPVSRVSGLVLVSCYLVANCIAENAREGL